jgi:GT2 family glycosyltransferase
VSATAALYRRKAIGARFFDPAFFAYYEDVELCARLHEQGWSTRVLPVIKATHRGSASASILGSDALRIKTRNRYWVARRHPGVGRVGALLREDLKKRPTIARIRGVWEGLRT